MTTFKELGLNKDIQKSLEALGFEKPSPIQEKSIPFVLNSRQDLIALAQTGTGKTAAFSLPILNQIEPGKKNLQAIVICPTRELGIQISQDIKKFTKYSKEVSVTAVYGGERIGSQIKALRDGTNIVVGTPGRLHDLIRRKVLKLDNIKWLVLDEADEMLDMGFKDDLDAILSEIPMERQTLLFSATMSKSVHAIAKQYMTDAEEISVGSKNEGAKNVSHEYYIVQSRDRFEALKRVLDSLPGVYGILFCRTKNETQEVADRLKQSNYSTDVLHGDITQTMRTKIMDRFKRKQISLLVATDVAARGIDVNDLSHVINYNLPDQTAAYTHRSGRTGRAQKSGVSISIITPREKSKIRRLEDIIGKNFEHKKVPGGEEVCKNQIGSFLLEVKNVNIEEIESDKYFSEIAEKLKKFKKDDLIKYFVNHRFGHLMESYKNVKDINADLSKGRNSGEKNDNHTRLKINVGKKHKFEVKDFFGMINSKKSLKGAEIGKIEITPDFSFFTVEAKDAEKMIKSLSGVSCKGEKIRVVKAEKRGYFSGRRRGSSGKRFKKGNRFKGGFNKRRKKERS